MKHVRNPNWCMPCPTNLPVVPTEFERKVKALGLRTERDMLHSPSLRQWAANHWKRRYVPESLLVAWNLADKFELENLE